MTLKDIAAFKHFIADRDLRRPFIKVYHRSKSFANNPDSIEDFFSDVKPLAVILAAARVCVPNSAYGYDFWQDLHQLWKVYYDKIQTSFSYTDREDCLSRLQGYYSILRENWDNSEKPWIHESISDTCERLHLPIFEIEETPEQERPLIDFSDDEEETTTTTPEVSAPDNDDPLAGFDFLDTCVSSANRLQRGEASLNFKNGGYKITFNLFDTAEIQDMTLVRLAKSPQGDICLIFNAAEGTKISFARANRKRNLTINSKDICTKLRTLLSIKADYSMLNIGKLSSSDKYIIYKISKQ